MKTLIATGIAVVGLAVSALAQNGIIYTNLAIGFTNASAGSSTRVSSPTIIKVENHQEIAVQWRQTWNLTNGLGINTNTLILGASQVPSNLVEIARITRSCPATTNTLTVDVGTNVYIGSFNYFGVIGFDSGATNSTVTNAAPDGTLGKIRVQTKANRSGIK